MSLTVGLPGLVGLLLLAAAGALLLLRTLRRHRAERSAPPLPALIYPVAGEAAESPSVADLPELPLPRRAAAPRPGLRGRGSAAVGGAEPAEEDERVQLLPGWLEILRGEQQGERLRFVRAGSERVVEVTLGRAEGERHRHLRLTGATVSRLHARMRFEHRTWRLQALSVAGPTRVNGRELRVSDEPLELRDGDLLQLGEVTLRFRGEAAKSPRARSAHASVAGKRAANEDAVLDVGLPDGRRLIAVADGMGGHHGGAVASRLTLDVVYRELCAGRGLAEAVRVANAEVHAAGQADPSLRGMGSTLVALLCGGDAYEIVNVGDSRAYRVDRAGIAQITSDHSFAAEALRSETLSAEEIARSPWRNALMRAVGAKAEVEVDSFGPFAVDSGAHAILLCSDGLYRQIAGESMRATLLGSADVEAAARRFAELGSGSEDNSSLAIVEFGALLAPGGAPAPASTAPDLDAPPPAAGAGG